MTYRLTDECLKICQQNGWEVIGVSAHIPEGERLERFLDLFDRYGYAFIIIPTIKERPDLCNPTRDEH